MKNYLLLTIFLATPLCLHAAKNKNSESCPFTRVSLVLDNVERAKPFVFNIKIKNIETKKDTTYFISAFTGIKFYQSLPNANDPKSISVFDAASIAKEINIKRVDRKNTGKEAFDYLINENTLGFIDNHKLLAKNANLYRIPNMIFNEFRPFSKIILEAQESKKTYFYTGRWFRDEIYYPFVMKTTSILNEDGNEILTDKVLANQTDKDKISLNEQLNEILANINLGKKFHKKIEPKKHRRIDHLFKDSRERFNYIDDKWKPQPLSDQNYLYVVRNKKAHILALGNFDPYHNKYADKVAKEHNDAKLQIEKLKRNSNKSHDELSEAS